MMKKNFNGTYRKMSNNNNTVFKTDRIFKKNSILFQTMLCSQLIYGNQKRADTLTTA